MFSFLVVRLTMAEGGAEVKFPDEPAPGPTPQLAEPLAVHAGQQGQGQFEQPAQPQELEVIIHSLLLTFVAFSQRVSCLIDFLHCEAETAHDSGVDY